MPKWLSSAMIFIGFLALVAMAVLPKNIEVTVTTNVKQASSHETTHHHHGAADVTANYADAISEDNND